MASVEFYKYYQLENGEYFRVGQRACTYQRLTSSHQWEKDDHISSIYYNHSTPYSKVNDPAALKRLQSYDKQRIPSIMVNQRQIDFPAQSVIESTTIEAVVMKDSDLLRYALIYFSGFHLTLFSEDFFDSVAEFFMQQGVEISSICFNYEQEDNYYHAAPIFPAEFTDYQDYEKNYWERRESASVEDISFQMKCSNFGNAVVGCNLHFPSEGCYVILQMYYSKKDSGNKKAFTDFILESMVSHE